MLEEDFGLSRPGKFNVVRGSVHTATLLTLILDRFAAENSTMSFAHTYPGLTATKLLT